MYKHLLIVLINLGTNLFLRRLCQHHSLRLKLI